MKLPGKKLSGAVPEKAREIERVEFEGKEIILVGTAHISRESVALVRKTIEEEKPDAVGVELDRQRFAQLKSGKKWMELDIFQVIRSGQSYLLLLNLLLAGLQKRFGDSVGVKPGEEMMEAISAAEESGANVVLLDRDISITMKRVIGAMGLIEKMKLLSGLFMSFFGVGEKISASQVEELKQKDMLTHLIEELGREMPKTKKVLVDERDLYIANNILNAPAKKIVAVVGLGHLEGIKKLLDRKRDVSGLLSAPKARNYLAILKYAIPALLILLLAWGFYFKGFEAFAEMVVFWIAITAFCAALGALAARAHWKSVLAAFISAPVTTIHPALAAGWFAGYVEIKERSPKVRDFESLGDIKGIGDFYKNRVTRALLVVALTNVGATIGTLIALSFSASLLL
ncbi:MAG: TraB/GumN family protein [Candidatus Diapherotrites archaeon]